MMQPTELQPILSDWSFWDRPLPDTVMRAVDLPSRLHADLALIIQGVRRSGKSTLMHQLPKHYQLKPTQCTFCNFEDPRLLEALGPALLDLIVKLGKAKHPKGPHYFFFDEIQNVPHWEKWLHTQLALQHDNYFVVTGSNAALLSGEFGSTLTGRHLTLELFPFSLEEYRKIYPDAPLKDYVLHGGFPRALTIDTPQKLLQEYFSDIIMRDIVKRTHARSAQLVMQIIKMAFETTGSELSYRRIAAVSGTSVDTVKNYLDAAAQAYLLFACPFFAFSHKKQQSQNKKFYPIDPALAQAVSAHPGDNLGKHFENLVFIQLKKRYGDVYYWKTENAEVDFVVLSGSTPIPYQVTWDAPHPRHEKALEAFYAQFPQAGDPVWVDKRNAEEFFAMLLP